MLNPKQYTLFLFALITFGIKAQEELLYFQMDSVPMKFKAFTAEDFIKSTKRDTSFYRAFKNLKVFNYESKTAIKVFKRDGDEKAGMKRSSTHYCDSSYSWITRDKEKTEGKFYKRNGEHRYFTAEMYDRVFFPTDTFKASNIVNGAYEQQNPESRGKIEKYYEQLKTFMFSPGTKVDGVPLIGKKLDIFGEKMRPYYDYQLKTVLYKDSIACYRFTVKRKENVKESKVVIQLLETYYDRRTMKIIARDYQLKDRNLMFDFDIKMNIQLIKVGDEYFPKSIKYKGEWDVPLKRPERLEFQLSTRKVSPKNKVKK